MGPQLRIKVTVTSIPKQKVIEEIQKTHTRLQWTRFIISFTIRPLRHRI